MAGDLGLGIFGIETICPKRWHLAYGPGSKPGTDERVKPTKDELVLAIENVYDKLCSAASSGDADKLAAKHNLGLLLNTPLETVGHLVSHLLASHFSIHLGQLSAIRRQTGGHHCSKRR